jgi:DNA-binding XRE family transcriptional regulator
MENTINSTKLRDARGSRSVTAVAEAIGISRQHLWQIETGKRKPGSVILAKLCWLYDLDISDVAKGFTNGKRKAA